MEIGEEIKVQNAILDNLDTHVDVATDGLKEETKHAEEVRVGMLGLQRFHLRAIAHDNLGALQRRIEEGRNVLLDGDASDIEEEGPRPVLAAQLFIDARQVRVELFGVHPSRPRRDVAEAAFQQFDRPGVAVLVHLVAQGGARPRAGLTFV